jgi:hypothetical protein
LREVEAPTLIRQTANRWRQGCQPYVPAALYPQVSFLRFLVLPGALSPGVKRRGYEADHAPLSSAEVKNVGGIPPLPHTSSWRKA